MDSIYNCERLYVPPGATSNHYTLIHLDCPVRNRKPIAFSQKRNAAVGDSVFVIGNPFGLPTKYADDAKIRSLTQTGYVANTDTFGGNSGSAIFDAQTLKAIGMLTSGESILDISFIQEGLEFLGIVVD